jgi:hypothetical protein
LSKDTPAPPSQDLCFEGGTQQYNDEAVEVRTGVTYSTLSSPVAAPVAACSDPSKTPYLTDGITIKIKCKNKPHLLQFVYREIIKADGSHVSQSFTNKTGSTYNTTTDPAHPNWNTDSASSPNPYYEGAGVYRTDDDGLTTFDVPGLNSPGPGETWRATFKSYAICDGKVVREITWVREKKSGSAPTYTASVAKASGLPDWAKKQITANGYDSKP